eukprot:6484305-Amphidinium_carterae.1
MPFSIPDGLVTPRPKRPLMIADGQAGGSNVKVARATDPLEACEEDTHGVRHDTSVVVVQNGCTL